MKGWREGGSRGEARKVLRQHYFFRKTTAEETFQMGEISAKRIYFFPRLLAGSYDVNVSYALIDASVEHFKEEYEQQKWPPDSVTRLGDLLDFGQLLKAFGNN